MPIKGGAKQEGKVTDGVIRISGCSRSGISSFSAGGHGIDSQLMSFSSPPFPI